MIVGSMTACTTQTNPLNVVVLFTDDQRWNTIHALGNENISTPNMDRLASMGVSFNRAYVMGAMHGAVCAPSRAMLLSGKSYFNIPRDYIDQGRVARNTTFDFVTFPELLRERGYQTFFTGKWHNHTSKIAEGFEDGENIFIGGMHWPKEGGHRKPMIWDYDISGEYAKKDRRQGDRFSSEMYADAALGFLDKRDATDPFCLYVAFTSPHDPREAPDAYLNLYDTASIALPSNYLPQHPFDNGHLKTRDENLAAFPRTPTIVKQEIAAYYAMISEVDAQIGRVLDKLEEQNLLDETIIVFAGDNGLAVGQHGLLGKQSVYEHSVRVPLTIVSPGVKGNRVSKSLCYLFDIFPTITDLLNIDPPSPIDGISLKPVLENVDQQIRSHLFLSHAQEMRSIRTADDHKLIRYFVNGKHHEQLFDLQVDPWETQNLATDTNYSNLKDSLEKLMINDISSFNDEFLKLSINISSEQLGGPAIVDMNASMPIGSIKYTVDGSVPSLNSTNFKSPFTVTESTVIKAAIFHEEKRVGQEESAHPFVQQNIKSVELSIQPSERYPGFGEKTLVNGPNGRGKLRNGQWIGYESDDLIAVVELKKPQIINEVGIRYLNQPGNWIFPPKSLNIFVSSDGKNYAKVSSLLLPEGRGGKSGPMEILEKVNESKIGFVKFEVENIGICPDWHLGDGGKAWLFIDELFIH